MRRRDSKSMSRREFVGATVAATVSGAVPMISRSGTARPNVVFILADDLGYGDLSSFGRPDYDTPNLDRLAREGIRFTSAYSASPLCTPTRCGFITGRYPARTRVGLEEPLDWKKSLGDEASALGLPPDHPTLASLLKKSGYETSLVGKWHLGYLPWFGPLQSGFDEFFGILSGGVDYFSHKDGDGEPDLFEASVPVERIGYLTDLLTERALKVISRRRSRPFYLSLHYTAPHWPWEGPGDAAIGRGAGSGLSKLTAGGSLKTFAEMVKRLDDGVGEVMKYLRRSALDRNTLVIFTSDNGGERFSYNWPFRGQKFQLWEGGIRVPAIVRWPGVVPPHRSTEQVAITMDWTATILGVTGSKPDANYPLDGNDLMPICKGGAAYERKFFWRNGKQDAARKGRWKYLNDNRQEYLFDLATDQREQADFKERRPEVLGQLKKDFDQWQSQMLPRKQNMD